MATRIEIGVRAQSFAPGGRTARGGVFDRQPGIARDLDPVVPLESIFDEADPLVDGEQGLAFVGVRSDRDDEVVEDAQRTLDHVEMPVSEGIEAAWVDVGLVTQPSTP